MLFRSQIGMAETVGAGYEFQQSYVENIRTITPEDIIRVAKRYLVRDRRTVGVLVPQKKQTETEEMTGSHS